MLGWKPLLEVTVSMLTHSASNASASVMLAHHTCDISFSEMALFSKNVSSCGFVGLQSHFTLTHFFPAQNWHSRYGVWQGPLLGLGPVSFLLHPIFWKQKETVVCVWVYMCTYRDKGSWPAPASQVLGLKA